MVKTLIIGGGLSGLALAEMLQSQGADYLLVDARDRFGGRIKTQHHGPGYFDMGPAWFWPGQPRMAALIARLGLRAFAQFADGSLLFEDAQGRVERGRGFASMQGSYRLEGGLGRLTDTLAARLPEDRKRLNTQITALSKVDAGVIATATDGQTFTADRVVLALPPRVAAELSFAPDLPAQAHDAMGTIATWMAGQAKAVAVYDAPIWRDAGLSGDATSRHGPMVEVHDASPAQGGPFAVFGFIGVPPQGRRDVDLLRQHILAQLVRLFGPSAADPLALMIKDWAFDSLTSVPADQRPLYAHPTYGLPDALRGLWQGQLMFAGTEVAPEFGGYLEGALEAAENVLNSLSDQG